MGGQRDKGMFDNNWPWREWETGRSRDMSKMTPGLQAFEKMDRGEGIMGEKTSLGLTVLVPIVVTCCFATEIQFNFSLITQ